MKHVKHNTDASCPGRPTTVAKGLMLAIIYVLYTRLVRGKAGKKRLSVTKALEVIEWILGWIGRNPAHFYLTSAELMDARITEREFFAKAIPKRRALGRGLHE